MIDFVPRATCARCRRAQLTCVCDLAAALVPRTQVIFLQHPRERRTAIGTALLAHLGLGGSHLRVGLDFAADPVVSAAVARTPRPYLLFPGPGAVDVATLPPEERHTVVVLDGTWAQAKKLLRLNPALAALPRLSFTSGRKSEYAIRRQPADYCLSTIEALGEVMTALEPPGFPIERLCAPFFAMVAQQQRFAREIHSSRHRRPPRIEVRVPRARAELRAARERLVCVHGEANAWPLRHPSWQPAEILHWVAHRPASGASFEALIPARRPLAPSALRHLELAPEDFASGDTVATVDGWRARFAAFLRPDDVVVGWGDFACQVARRDQLALPDEIDLRALAAQWRHEKAGPVDRLSARLGLAPARMLGRGRAGRRLAHLVALVDHFTA